MIICFRSNYSDSKVYLLGDFNINLINFRDNLIENFINIMFSLNMQPMIRRPTRISQYSASIIDHIWTNDESVCNSGILKLHVTDHFSIFVTAKTGQVENRKETFVFRDFRLKNRKKFSSQLNCVSLDNSQSLI